MGKLHVIGIIVLLAFALVACQPDNDDPLPTVAQIPSATPSFTPTATHTPTATPLPLPDLAITWEEGGGHFNCADNRVVEFVTTITNIGEAEARDIVVSDVSGGNERTVLALPVGESYVFEARSAVANSSDARIQIVVDPDNTIDEMNEDNNTIDETLIAPTPCPSDTPQISSTPTASHTPRATATNTLTPSHTPTITPSVTPTPIATDTATATLTAIPTRTPDAVDVTLFQSNVSQAEQGSAVRFRWATINAEIVLLQRIDTATSNAVESIEVDPMGAVALNLPQVGTEALYRLTARNGTSVDSMDITILLGEPCTREWAVSPVPRDGGCPQTTTLGGQYTYQRFEQGLMFRYQWSTVNGAFDRICALQFDRNLYSCYAPEPYTGTPPVTPDPNNPNQFDAGDIFKDVYYNELALGGLWYNIIGFGLEAPVASAVIAQEGADNRLYIQSPVGTFGFDDDLDGVGQPFVRVNATQSP